MKNFIIILACFALFSCSTKETKRIAMLSGSSTAVNKEEINTSTFVFEVEDGKVIFDPKSKVDFFQALEKSTEITIKSNNLSGIVFFDRWIKKNVKDKKIIKHQYSDFDHIIVSFKGD